MPAKPQLDWTQYKATYDVVIDAQNAEKIDDLGVRALRLADALPLVGIFYQMFRRARLDMAKHLKVPKGKDEGAWTRRFLELTTVNARTEGALAAFMTLAETALDDQAMALKLRIQSVIELIYTAEDHGHLNFPKPDMFDRADLVDSLNGAPSKQGKHSRTIRVPRVERSTKTSYPKKKRK